MLYGKRLAIKHFQKKFNETLTENSVFKGVRMEKVKETKEYKIYKKRNGRHAVTEINGAWINKEKKNEILKKEGLIKTMKPKAKPAAEAAPATEQAPS